MEESGTELQFRCPKEWESMTPTFNGRFCTDCKKTVIDFSNVSAQKVSRAVQTNGKELCGNFYAYQLRKPFGNWKDKVISIYQKRFLTKSSLQPIVLIFLTVLLIMTGCARRVRGMVSPKCDNRQKNHTYNTLTKLHEPTKHI